MHAIEVDAACAALENARWCDLVCRAHGVPTRFEAACWIAPGPVPRYYPRLITLGGPDRSDAHVAAVRALVAREQESALAVKDAFGALDLTSLGFRSLFEAEWIALPLGAAPARAPEELSWWCAADAAALARWEAAWSGATRPLPPALFPPSLLGTPGLDFVAVERRGELVGTFVLHASDGVVGLSNAAGAYPAAIAAAAHLARERYPGSPLVGYEHGDELEAALEAGFERLGRLVVWGRGA